MVLDNIHFSRIDFKYEPTTGEKKLDDMIQKNMIDLSNRVTEAQERLVIQHLDSFLKYLIHNGFCEPVDRYKVIEDYLRYFVNVNSDEGQRIINFWKYLYETGGFMKDMGDLME